MNKKNTGSYYTPLYLADFISKRVLAFFENRTRISVLEPSVGDGIFVQSLFENKTNTITLTALDINSKELARAEKKWSEKNSTFSEIDFLNFEAKKKFSLIIGNPPYVKKNRLSDEQIEVIKEIHDNAILSKKSVKNIWVTFLIKSSMLLAKNGVLAFVLPAELLQVKFAEEVREYLKKEFDRIEIFTFDDLMFECKGQDTIVLFAYKKHSKKGEFFTNIKSQEVLEDNSFVLKKNSLLVESKVKWTHHFLSSDELIFLEKLKQELRPIKDYINSKPGIVTAANSFFIIDKKTEKKYKLSNYTKPIIQKGLFVNGSVVFDEVDFLELENSEKPAKLLQLNDSDVISIELKEYLEMGETLELPERYKCKTRKNWYVIPNISTKPDAFFFKRSHHYPKLLKNNSDAFVTDSAYKVSVKNGTNLNSFVYSFYNSLTLTFAETDGRYYGGGVLELTPNEFKGLSIPYKKIYSSTFSKFRDNFENKKNIEQILEKNDIQILKSLLNLSLDDIQLIQGIRRKLIKKRMRS